MTGAEDWSHKGLVVKYVHLGPLWYLSVPVQHTPKMSKNNFLLKEQASNKNQHFLKPFWEWTLLLNSIFYTKVTKNICHTSNVFEIPPVKPSSRYNGTTCPNRNINQVVFSPLGGGIKNAYAFVNHQDIDRITWMKSMTWAIHSGFAWPGWSPQCHVHRTIADIGHEGHPMWSNWESASAGWSLVVLTCFGELFINMGHGVT